jgi:hypothetical protein
MFHTLISVPDLNFLLDTAKYLCIGYSKLHYIKENIFLTATEIIASC